MKKLYSILPTVLLFLFWGCTSTPEKSAAGTDAKPVEHKIQKASSPVKDKKARLEQAVLARDRYTEFLKHAKTAEETDKARKELEFIQSEIEALETGGYAEEDDFSGPRTIIYGPLGLALQITEFTLKKLFIIYD